MKISNIPEKLICIDHAKLSLYNFPADFKVLDTHKKKSIAVFCLVKEYEMDNIVYYDGWDPQSRGKKIVEMLLLNQK